MHSKSDRVVILQERLQHSMYETEANLICHSALHLLCTPLQFRPDRPWNHPSTPTRRPVPTPTLTYLLGSSHASAHP